MQALGAYAFLGLVKGHKHFLQYIPRATRSLRDTLSNIESLDQLAAVVGEL
jgi:hypothetical protein